MMREDRPRIVRYSISAPDVRLIRPDRRLPAIVAEPDLRARLIKRARKDDVSMSEVIRRALRLYVGLPE